MQLVLGSFVTYFPALIMLKQFCEEIFLVGPTLLFAALPALLAPTIQSRWGWWVGQLVPGHVQAPSTTEPSSACLVTSGTAVEILFEIGAIASPVIE